MVYKINVKCVVGRKEKSAVNDGRSFTHIGDIYYYKKNRIKLKIQ